MRCKIIGNGYVIYKPIFDSYKVEMQIFAQSPYGDNLDVLVSREILK